ncbi:MAG: hypothetical protein PHX21_10080 [bacterium]|nr:hypothetical protein [bacterium]
MDIVREIEKQIEDWIQRRPFIKNPLPYSIWYLLTVHEEYIQALATQDISTLPISTHSGKYALKYCLSWIYNASPKKDMFQRPTYINNRRYSEANELFDVGLDYMFVESAYIMYSREWVNAEIMDAHTVKFIRTSAELSYDVLDNIIGRVRDNKSFSNSFPNSSRYVMQSNDLEKIIDSIKPIGDNAITYKIDNDMFYNAVQNLSNILEGIFFFPSNWKFRNISISAFRSVWRVLNTLCEIHSICHLYAYRKVGTLASRSKVLLITREELTDKISAGCDITRQEIIDILTLMQYDTSLKKPDPALQPLIEISKNFLAITPQFIMGCNHERNLIALLARNFKNEYDNTTNILESALIDEIKEELSSTDFYLAYHKSSPCKDLPDIDWAIAAPSSSILIIGELKWVIQPSDTSEIIERAEAEQKGIQQAKKLLGFGRTNPDKLWEQCFPDKKIPQNLSVHACVVMRGFVGTDKNWTPEVPVIELSLLLKKLKEKVNLETIVNWMESRGFLPIQGKDYTKIEHPIKIGDYTIIGEAYELKR